MAVSVVDFAKASRERLLAVPERLSHIHLLGIGGSAMTAVAGMLVSRGFRVSGSDVEIYEPAASLLRRLRVEIHKGFDAKNLDPRPDLVVIGNVITAANPEAAAVLERGIPYLSMPEAVRHFFLKERRVLAVVGTHGKTTSSAMLAHVLSACGRDPGMLIGGVALNFDSNWLLGGGPEFVIEGDEYDTAFFDKRPKFLHYHPWGIILTAVEFDHADIYRDLEHVKGAFRALATQLKPDGRVAVCADHPDALAVVEQSQARKLTFGLNHGEFRAEGITVGEHGASFWVSRCGERMAPRFMLPLWGRMNVVNALGVVVLARELGIADADIASAIASFKGVARRQQVVGEAGGVVVVDDFAHHPTAVKATLAAIVERFPKRRLIVAFEPRSNTSRRRVFQQQFASAFDLASHVFLAPVYFKENDPLPVEQRLDVQVLAEEISQRGPRARAMKSNDELLAAIVEQAREGDVVVFMSNGPFDNLKYRFLEALKLRAA